MIFLQILILVLRSTLLLNMWMRKNWPLWEIIYTGLKQTGLNSWYVKTMGDHRGIRTGICPSLEIGTKNQNFLENLTSAAPFPLIDLFLAMTVYQPVRNSRCTRARFTALVSCSTELAVYSCPLLCPYSGFNFSHYESPFPTRYCIPYVRSDLYQLVIRVKGFRVCALHCVRVPLRPRK